MNEVPKINVDNTNENLKCWNKWNENSITERQEVLYELSKSVWSINN